MTHRHRNIDTSFKKQHQTIPDFSADIYSPSPAYCQDCLNRSLIKYHIVACEVDHVQMSAAFPALLNELHYKLYSISLEASQKGRERHHRNATSGFQHLQSCATAEICRYFKRGGRGDVNLNLPSNIQNFLSSFILPPFNYPTPSQRCSSQNIHTPPAFYSCCSLTIDPGDNLKAVFFGTATETSVPLTSTHIAVNGNQQHPASCWFPKGPRQSYRWRIYRFIRNRALVVLWALSLDMADSALRHCLDAASPARCRGPSAPPLPPCVDPLALPLLQCGTRPATMPSSLSPHHRTRTA